MKKKQEVPDDERAIFVPAEDIQIIERVLNDWERVKQEFLKVEAKKKKDNIIEQN